MPISSNCPMCGHKWQAPDQAQGRNVRCPECLTVYGIPGAASPTGGSKAGAPKPTSPSSSGTAPRPATAKSHAGASVVRPSGSSQGGVKRPVTAGSHAGNQAIRRATTDTPSPFSEPTANIPAPPMPRPAPAPAPVPRPVREPEVRRRGGMGVVAILAVFLLLVMLAGGGIVGLILLKKAVNPADSGAVAKVDEPAGTKPVETKPAETKATETPRPETKPAPTTDKKAPTNPDKKPPTDPKTPPDTKTVSKDPPKTPPDNSKPPETPKKPAKPVGPRDGELVNVVNGPMVLGEGQLTVVSAGLGVVLETETKDKYLIVKLSLQNTSKNNRIDFQGWGAADPINDKFPVHMFDSMGNEVKRITFPAGKVLAGQTLAETLHPGVAKTDVLVFAVPPADSLYVKLIVPGPTDERKGTFRALIPAARYQEAVVVAKPDPKPQPKPEPKPEPEKKPDEPVRPGPKPPALPAIKTTPEINQLVNGPLKSQKPDERIETLAKIGKLPEETIIPAIPLFMPSLFDGDPKVRVAAAELIEKLIPKADGATAFAVARVGHSYFDGNVRQIMFKWLNQMDPKSQECAIPELAAALGNADPKVQLGAVEILAKLGGEKTAWALPELAAAAQDSPNDQVRQTAAHLIGEFGPKAVSVVPGLARRVTIEPTPAVRAEVVKTLGLIGPGAAPALADLKTALQDPDADVQKLAREAIKLIDTK